MNNTIQKLVIISSILLCGQVSAASIGWGIAPASVGVNDTFSIDIVGEDFSGNVDGGGVNFSYNSSILNVLSVSINPAVWDFGGFGISTGSINNTTGNVSGVMVNTFGNVTGDFVVATVQMQAVGAGTSGLSLTEYALNPWASGGVLINPSFINSSLSVIVEASAVPVPAAALLFCSGLLGLIGLNKKFHN